MWNHQLLAFVPLLAPAFAAVAPHCDPSPSEVRFATPRTTVWLDRSQVLAFRLEPAPPEDLSLTAEVHPAHLLEVLRQPRALGGRQLGYLRVRGLTEGTCTVRVGGAELRVVVRAVPGGARLQRVEPTIVAPVAGAVVWGRFAVGVELPASTPADLTPTLRLSLPGGDLLEPLHPPDLEGPGGRVLFEVDAADLPPGPQLLRALVLEEGVEIGSSAVLVTVAHPEPGALLGGECEDTLGLPRPEGFGPRSPAVGADAGASGGRFALNFRQNPPWTLPLEIPTTGRYQLVVTARGDRGGGAFPSIGLAVDRPAPVQGTTRLVDRRWHRLPVGPPVLLEGGERVLAVRYLNDFTISARSDRNLYLDRWELLRVGDATETDSAAVPRREREASGIERSAGLWVAFERVLDGLVVNGHLEIVGACSWLGTDTSPAPRVSLLVDGEPLATQIAARPYVELDRAHLGQGTHEIALEAHLPDGRHARTPVQRVVVPGPVAPATPRDVLRFGVLDERWEGLAAVLDGEGEELRQRVARPREEVEASILLPDDLQGDFEVLVEARGPGNDGAAARLRVRVETEPASGDGPRTLEELEVRHWWSLRPAGEVSLASGPKRLLLTLQPRESRPELRVRGVVLRRQRPAPDSCPPGAHILYPAAGHAAHGVDAVVVEAFDDDALQAADVVIDGRPQGTFGHVPRGAGHLVLPLLLRDAIPGKHTLAVRVTDRAGNMVETAEQTFTVLAEPGQTPGPYDRALHLLDRFAFGPEPGELAELLTLGERAWLQASLAERGSGDATARGLAATRHGERLAYDAGRLLLSYALRTDNPLRTRFVLWVDDHFSTWAGKTGAPSEWVEHQRYARLGLAPFQELLTASATSPTMLFYLDQQQSFAGRINENYARELMELHTVGVDGGYTQEEVTSLALLLTGLTVVEESPADGAGNYLRRVLRFDPELGDGRPCTLLGWRFEETPAAERLDRLHQALELLAAHPSTARFLGRKLAEHYVSAPAPEKLVEDLAAVFTEHGGDFQPVLMALAEHPDFWAAMDAPRLATPLDYGLRLGRTTGVPQVDWSLESFLRSSGMGLFDCVTPDGYPDEDAAWADTNGMVQRWRWVQAIPWAVRALVPNAARPYRGGDPAAWRQRVVDHAAVRLTGRTLGAQSNASALEFLGHDEGGVGQRVDRLTILVCRLPEANLK